MKNSSLILFGAACGIILLAIACGKRSGPESGAPQKEMTLGEKIFAEKECGKCHTTGDQTVEKEMKAPDLASVFLAVDTVFVKSHLRFIELSQMPSINLTPEEIDALTHYVASLHAKAKTDPNLEKPDGRCPVCGALLKIEQAKTAQLQASHADKVYNFECADCKRMFEMNPDWYAQHGYVAAR
jgi:mono/diheme cytochrome c family protein/YHS domain-containing protein